MVSTLEHQLIIGNYTEAKKLILDGEYISPRALNSVTVFPGRRSYEMLEFMIKHGANVNEKSDTGMNQLDFLLSRIESPTQWTDRTINLLLDSGSTVSVDLLSRVIRNIYDRIDLGTLIRLADLLPEVPGTIFQYIMRRSQSKLSPGYSGKLSPYDTYIVHN